MKLKVKNLKELCRVRVRLDKKVGRSKSERIEFHLLAERPEHIVRFAENVRKFDLVKVHCLRNGSKRPQTLDLIV